MHQGSRKSRAKSTLARSFLAKCTLAKPALARSLFGQVRPTLAQSLFLPPPAPGPHSPPPDPPPLPDHAPPDPLRPFRRTTQNFAFFVALPPQFSFFLPSLWCEIEERQAKVKSSPIRKGQRGARDRACDFGASAWQVMPLKILTNVQRMSHRCRWWPWTANSLVVARTLTWPVLVQRPHRVCQVL